MEKSRGHKVIAQIILVPGLKCWERDFFKGGVVGAFLAFSRV